MKADIANVIAEYVREEDSDLENRFESQAEVLGETRCTEPVIGRWIDANDVEQLLAAFALGDEDFAERFPSMAHVTSEKRQRCLETIEVHFHHCTHCALKRSYDLELDMRIERAYREHRDALLHQLKGDETETSDGGDHVSAMEAILAI
jgi:hypothetical protein